MHALRGGDGGAIPEVEPPELWPEMDVLDPYWEEFTGFARSELDGAVEYEFHMRPDGSWYFEARQEAGRDAGRRKSLKYDPEEDTITFNDPEVDSGWEMTDAFGDRPLSEANR